MTTVQRTVDDLIDAALIRHHEWREDADTVAGAARLWPCAPAGDRCLHCAVYVAALDQEQAAAGAYSESIADLDWRSVRLTSAEQRVRIEANQSITNLAARSGAIKPQKEPSK